MRLLLRSALCGAFLLASAFAQISQPGGSSGSGTPGGSSGQLQMNNAGAFGGVTGSSVDGSGNVTVVSIASTASGGEGGPLRSAEGTSPTSNCAASGFGCIWADVNHFWKSNLNNGTNAFLTEARGVNAQTGTTYTYVTGDCFKLVTHSNASAITGTLPDANSTTFPTGCAIKVQNKGAGTLTINRTSISQIDGATSLSLTTNQGVELVSDGTNWNTLRGVSGSGSAAGMLFHIGVQADTGPSDATTYYLGLMRSPNAGLETTFNNVRIRVPVACTVKDVFLRQWESGTAGSGESVTITINKNGTTDSTSTTAVWNNSAGTGVETDWNPNMSLAAGDYIAVKFVTPTWVTNPTGVSFDGHIYCE